MANVSDLKKAKGYSDVRQYDAKHSLVNQLVRQAPAEFYIDSEQGNIVGLTHRPTGFRIHVPREVVQDMQLESMAKAAAPAAIGIGFGLPTPGGTVSKMTRPTSRLKGKLTNDVLKAEPKGTPEAAPAADPMRDMFKATREFQARRAQPGMKQANTTFGDMQRYLGYSPGTWYDEGSHSADAQRRIGNVVTGAGLSALGLASVPVLQYLFPERFQRKGKALGALAVLAGMGAPWVATLPGTLSDISRLGSVKNEDFTPEMQAAQDAGFRARLAGINRNAVVPGDPEPEPAAGAGNVRYHVGPRGKEIETDSTHTRALDPARQVEVDAIAKARTEMARSQGHLGGAGVRPTVKTNSAIPLSLQLSKTHLADTLAEQVEDGQITYAQALGLMNSAGRAQPDKPWFTVRDVAHAAIGAGAGALAGTVAAKGIGLFMNISPTEQRVMQGTGAALGTLINLGKLGI
jgi:hypothetical protein